LSSRHEDALSILSAAIAAADPYALVQAALAGQPFRRWSRVLAVGKAAPAMYQGAFELAGAQASLWKTLMVIPRDVPGPDWALRADHPLPTEQNINAAKAVVRFVAEAPPGEPVLVLLSGGSSSLLTLPAEGLSLDDVRTVTRALLAGGADIRQLNCVRKHMEQLKGGRLGVLFSGTPVDILALSDVVGDDLATLGSGPFTTDPTTFAEALDIVQQLAPGSASALKYLSEGARGQHPETPKPGDGGLEHIRTRVIGNNMTAVTGARHAAERLGYTVLSAESGMVGEAAAAGERLTRLALAAARPGAGRVCIIVGGETTVTVTGKHGRGGRNQELVLAAAVALEGRREITVGSVGTDGVDGPTDAAGAIADGTLIEAALRLGLDARQSLQTHDSYTLFARLEALIRTGPTGTNVNDVAIGLISPSDSATGSLH
jgi:glycerate 2-kinase